MKTNHHRFTKCAVLIVAVFQLLALAGCETLGEDISGITEIINPTSPSEAARMMVNPHDADDRRRGTVLLAGASFGGVPVYVEAYRDLVSFERDPIVKASAIRALARHGEPEDALRIMPHLTHSNFQVRWESAKALQRIHNKAVVGELLKVLLDESEHQDVRVATAVALGQYAEDRVFQGLLSALESRELAVNKTSERSLEILTGKSFGLNASRWLHWYNTVAPTGDAFAGRGEYLFPTYSRDESLLEKFAFWTKHNFEQPAPPIGLRPASERRTYPDSDVVE